MGWFLTSSSFVWHANFKHRSFATILLQIEIQHIGSLLCLINKEGAISPVCIAAESRPLDSPTSLIYMYELPESRNRAMISKQIVLRTEIRDLLSGNLELAGTLPLIYSVSFRKGLFGEIAKSYFKNYFLAHVNSHTSK